MEPKFENIFRIPTLALNFNGINPNIIKGAIHIFRFVITHGIYTLLVLLVMYNIIECDLRTNNFTQACKNGTLVIVYLQITNQCSNVLLLSRRFRVLFENVKNDYERHKTLPVTEQKVMSDYANKGLWICKIWVVISFGGVIIFLIKNFVLIVHTCWTDQCLYVPFYNLVYPLAVIEETKANNIYVYGLTYVLLLYFATYSAINYTAFVPLGPIFILHLCGQLDIVEMRVKDIFSEYESDIIKKKLTDIIQQLQYIHSFQDKLNESLSVVYELTLKITSIILPITTYEVLEAFGKGDLSVEFIVFIVGAVVISSSICFYSDLLMEKGENVRFALYSCGWEKYFDLRARTTLNIILARTIRPVVVTTMFRTVCLQTLSEVFQQSYGLFNLINTMWN